MLYCVVPSVPCYFAYPCFFIHNPVIWSYVISTAGKILLNKVAWYVRDARLDLGCETFPLNFNGFPNSLWAKVDWHLSIVHDFHILLCLSSSSLSSLLSSSSSAAAAAAFRALWGFTPQKTTILTLLGNLKSYKWFVVWCYIAVQYTAKSLPIVSLYNIFLCLTFFSAPYK